MYRLRELEEKDLETLNLLRNDKTIIDFLGAPFRFINYEVDLNWYKNYMQNRSSSVRCAIVDDSDKMMGLVSLTGIDHFNQSCQFHIMIGIEYQGRGVGSFAIKKMLNHAFNNLNMNRVELTCLETNERAIYLYEKNGFVKEGIKRLCNYKNGKFVNMIMYSILKEEYIAICLYRGGQSEYLAFPNVFPFHVITKLSRSAA